jgi:prevent-host-death family protein
MKKIGIRELKNSLSRHVRRVEAGERLLVTDRGRVVAALVPPGAATGQAELSPYDALVAAGLIRPALESGPLIHGMRTLRLPKGTAARLIDEDRGSA